MVGFSSHSKEERNMTTSERTTAVGVFSEPALAEQAMNQLRGAGFNDEQIGFVSRDINTAPSGSNDEGGNAPSTATGAVSGGVIGGVIGAVTSLLIPGFGPAIAGGILAATLGGVALGALAGGFVGSLTHLGVPEHEARFYESQLNEGRTVVTVNAPGRYGDAMRILRQAGAYDANVSNDAPAIDNDRAGNAYADPNADTIPPVVYPAGLAGIDGPAGTVNPGLPAATAFAAVNPSTTDPLAGSVADEDTVQMNAAGQKPVAPSVEDEDTVLMNAAGQNPVAPSVADEDTVQMNAAGQKPAATAVADEDTVIMNNPGRNPEAAAAYGTDTTTPQYNGPLPAPARATYTGTDTTTPGTDGINDPSYRHEGGQPSDPYEAR